MWLDHATDADAIDAFAPCKRPLNHGGARDGRFDAGSADTIYAIPFPPSVGAPSKWPEPSLDPAVANPHHGSEDLSHRAYGALGALPAGEFAMFYVCQPSPEPDSRTVCQASLVAKDDGTFIWEVRHPQPFSVETLYAAQKLTCGGEAE